MQQKSEIVSLYFSKKLKSLIGKDFFNLATIPDDHIEDEFYRWYGDIFYVNRKKHLVFANGSSKFTFLIPHYKVDQKANFFHTFTKHLELALKHNDFDQELYLDNVEFFSHDTTVNRSAMAHLSQVKDMCTQVMVVDDMAMEREEEVHYINHYINSFITTYKDRKGYHRPAECFKEELEKRGMLEDKKEK